MTEYADFIGRCLITYFAYYAKMSHSEVDKLSYNYMHYFGE